MTKHTPGPWMYRPNKIDDWGTVRASDGVYLVALARSGREITVEEWAAHRAAGTDPYEANARLTAAAPDLLEQLRDLTEWVARCRSIEWESSPDEFLSDARAAIRKAEGTDGALPAPF